MPLLTLGASLLTSALMVRISLRPTDQAIATRALLILLLLMMLAVGARESGPRRDQVYILSLSARDDIELPQHRISSNLNGGSWVRGGSRRGNKPYVLCLTEDFRPVHIAKIDSRAVNFRLGMSAALIDHYYPRSDYRALASWLTQNTSAADVVIIGIPSIDQYYHRASYVFLRDDDERYDAYACGTGPVDRWTNLPLLYKTESLAGLVATGRRIVLVLYPGQVRAVLADGRRRNWPEQLAWSSADNGSAVVVVNPT